MERRKAAPAGLVAAPVAEADLLEGGSVETRVVPPAASGCRGDGGKH